MEAPFIILENQQIPTFNELESECFWQVFLKRDLNSYLAVKIFAHTYNANIYSVLFMRAADNVAIK